ncbi:LuxR C-terminal-related transcriptional regulator [Micromonospora sp. NPDC049047]|uniref:LuxR C-terminal-related transcriptional regulator n=1 Tax=Micromonospora sp. NPDC049047 TaxID=3155645 RepID=UPI0033F6D70A
MVMIERDVQMAELSEQFDRCSQGTGGLAIIRGLAATGKTALLYAFADRVGSRSRFVSAAGSPAEQHLPLGVVDQILQGVDVDPQERERARQMASDPQALPEILTTVWRIVHTNAASLPLLIGVDDVHLADSVSLQCLLFIARRVRNFPIMLVLNNRTRAGGHEYAQARTEMLRQPDCRQLRLPMLSEEGVAALLAHELDPHVAHSIAAGAYAVTGGNPLLAQALAEDWQASDLATATGQPSRLAVGETYADAVVSYLYRCGEEVLAVARAVAIMREPASVAVLAQLSDARAGAVKTVLDLLEEAGILLHGQCRHPIARQAVLDDMPPEHLEHLHRRAAQALHHQGGQPTAVAHHLVAAGDSKEPWETAILQESADSARTSGQLGFALDCLELAHRASVDDTQRAVTRSVLAQAEWRVDPARAVRHLGHLTIAITEGRLTGRHVVAPVQQLLWHGRVDEAAQILDQLAGEPQPDANTAADLRTLRDYLERCYPMLRHGDAARPGPEADQQTLILGEHLRSGEQLDDSPLAPMTVALWALVDPERAEATSASWMPMLAEAAGRGAGVWRGLHAAVRADQALLQGDLPAAAGLAATALTELSPMSWGVVVGAPLACLLTASAEMGRFEEAAAHLSPPMPDALLQTPFGLRYLRARGHLQLALSRPYAALSDFQTLGETLRLWDADTPAAVPWRLDAAQTLLRLGRQGEARELLDQQVSRLDSHDGRVFGRALRHLAATADVRERPRLLADAVRALQTAGDRLELAHALADLGSTYKSIGDSSRARITMRRAGRVAQECQASPLAQGLYPDAGNWSAALGPDRGGPTALSEAERRVGELAAQGLPNRQIAEMLHITTSTVEQHLTRVYRKLGVKSRTDLPTSLQIGPLGELASASGG